MLKGTDKSAAKRGGRQNTKTLETLETLKTLTYQNGRKDWVTRGLARAARKPEGTGEH